MNRQRISASLVEFPCMWYICGGASGKMRFGLNCSSILKSLCVLNPLLNYIFNLVNMQTMAVKYASMLEVIDYL